MAKPHIHDMSNVNHEIGNRKYELTNHLGNVLSIVSDKIISRDEGNDDVVDEYWADILQSTDYSPFGVALYNRKFEKTVEICHDDTDTVTTTIMNEDFTAGGSWTKLSLTGTGLSYGSGEMINTKSSTTAPALAVGAYKDFTVSTGGAYSVSMDLTSNTCGYPVSLSIKNSGGTVIANVSCTATGTHTLAFNLPGSGTYRVEIRRSINTICNFHVDNVIVVHHEITTTTTCENTPPWYRYAFNGMEKDDELKGDWNSYDFGARMLDPRLGRWLTMDPMANKYTSISPYTFVINSPLLFIDPTGKWVAKIVQNSNDGKYNLVFVPEEGDNLQTLALQLGLPEKTLIEKQPELKTLDISKDVELTLSNLEQVANINEGINFISNNQSKTNCANLADQCDGGTNVFLASESGNVPFFEGELGNDPNYTSKEVLEYIKINVDKYVPVSEKDSRIGDVITYRISPESEKELKSLMGPYAGSQILESERHFSIVVLKDKTGSYPAQILQKNGEIPFDFKVDDASDTMLPDSTVKYVPTAPSGSTSPINRRVEE